MEWITERLKVEGRSKTAEALLKCLTCNLLTTVAHLGYKLSEVRLSLYQALPFLPSVVKHSPRVSFTNGQRTRPEEGDPSRLSLSSIRECKCRTNKFLPEHNGGLGRQEDEMRKEDGGLGWGVSLSKSTFWTSPIGFRELLLHLISCPRVFKLQHKTSPGEFRQWARGRREWKGEEGEKNEGLKVQWRTKVSKWQCLTATSILKWCPCHPVLPKYWFFFFPLLCQKKKK